MKRKQKPKSDEKRWEETATLYENDKAFADIAKSSRVLSAAEQRQLLGASRTKQISLRLPEEDIEAMKEIANATRRPYQQLLVIAIEQYIDRVAQVIRRARGKKASTPAY